MGECADARAVVTRFSNLLQRIAILSVGGVMENTLYSQELDRGHSAREIG